MTAPSAELQPNGRHGEEALTLTPLVSTGLAAEMRAPLFVALAVAVRLRRGEEREGVRVDGCMQL